MKKQIKILEIMVFIAIIGFTFISCTEPEGGGQSNTTSYTTTNYTTTISGITYNLTISHIDNRAAIGDDYELIISRPESEKISIGKIISIGQGNLAYQPNDNGSPYFEMGLSGGNITHISGTITFNDGTSEEGPGSFPVNGSNQTPVADDFNINNLIQTVGSVTAVVITPKTGKSNGTITVYYNGSTALPSIAGTYTVTFNVTASAGWNAANGLSGGTFIIIDSNEIGFGNPSIKLFMDGNAIENGGTTTFSKTTGSYTVSIQSGTGTESNPFSLVSGNWVQGSITSNASGASVWYSFPVTIGETYRIWWDDGYQGSGNRSLYAYVDAKYGNGSWIFSYINRGWDTPRQFTANQTGIVKVRVWSSITGYTGTFGIVYTSNNNTRPVLEEEEYTDIVWYLNGNIVAQGASRTSITLSRQTAGIYQIAVFATLKDGEKNSGSYNFVIQ